METTVQHVYAGYSSPATGDQLTLIRRFLIADVYARFLGGSGDTVVFGLGVEVGEKGADDADRLRQRLESLRLSCDWNRTVVSSSREHCLLTQTIFLKLLEQDLVYRRKLQNGSGASASRWVARTNRFAEHCDFDSSPPHWNSDAVATQGAALGAVDGVEVRAVIPGLGDLLVFTSHPDSLSKAAFVSVSPNHPEIETLAPEIEPAQLQIDKTAGAVETSLRVAVPGVDGLLPLIVAPSVDDRFGPTAVLGIPDQDEVDRQIAKQLRPASGIALGSMRISSKPRASKRYRLPDLTVTHDAAWGAPVPIVQCPQCGPVPAPSADLPLQDDAPADRECPQCGGPASRDSARIDWRFDSMWMWPSICAEKRWEPASLVVWDGNDSEQLLWQRIAGYMLASVADEDSLHEGEPFARVLVHGSLDGDAPEGAINTADDLDECVARSGSDAVRFAILNAGSPGRSTHLYKHLIKHAERFASESVAQLEKVKARNRPVPDEIDPSTRSRRRLAAWSRIATEKVEAHLNQMEIHRATYDLILFQRRILEFESKQRESGGLNDADWDAIAVALVRLGRAAAPFVPELASQLQAMAGSVD